MRFLLAITIVALALAAVHARGDRKKGPELIVRESPAGRFKVMLGDDPKSEKKTLSTTAGKLELHSLTTTVGKDLVLAVSWTDYPESFRDVKANTLFDAVRDGMKTKDSHLETDKDVAPADPNPTGREIIIDHGKYIMRTRLYFIGTRLYQVTATGKRDEVQGALAGRFLASFELITK